MGATAPDNVDAREQDIVARALSIARVERAWMACTGGARLVSAMSTLREGLHKEARRGQIAAGLVLVGAGLGRTGGLVVCVKGL